MTTKKTMNQTDSMNRTVFLFFLAVMLVITYFLFATKLQAPTTETNSSVSTISGASDLDQSSDELNSVDIDGMDNGLSDLTKEVSAY